MKKLLLMALAMTCLWTTTHAQVGINTTNPNPGTILDINADNKGILIPRVNIDNHSSGTQIEGGTTNGLLVYNTNQDTGEGFYYWYNNQWIPMGSEFSWRLTGNSGVNPETNFIGTVTNDPLVFKTYNVERMRILSSNGYVGIGLGEQDPTQQLHIAGNLRVDGAFMPNNQAGAENQILLSKGVANPPVWGPGLLNVEQIENFAKWYSGLFNINSGYYLVTITDPNMTSDSTVSANFVGPLPAGPAWGYNLTLFAEPRDGEVIFHIRNASIYNISNLQIACFAIYAPN